jgi:hypothetical protein
MHPLVHRSRAHLLFPFSVKKDDPTQVGSGKNPTYSLFEDLVCSAPSPIPPPRCVSAKGTFPHLRLPGPCQARVFVFTYALISCFPYGPFAPHACSCSPTPCHSWRGKPHQGRIPKLSAQRKESQHPVVVINNIGASYMFNEMPMR